MDVTAPRTLTASALADAAAAIDATVVFASPAALRNVLATRAGLSRGRHVPWARVELLLSAGAPVPEALLAEVQRLLPAGLAAHPVRDDRGAARHGHQPRTDPRRRGRRRRRNRGGGRQRRLRGPPVHGARAAIVPLAADGTAPGNEPVTEAGVTGEILVSAPHVKDSYDRLWLTQRESVRTAGWHRTGDVGHLDAAGRLWVEGRLAHVVTAPGAVVTPVGAEQAIERLDDVGLAAVVGVGPSGTQAVVAVVETVPPVRRAGPAAPQLAGPRPGRRPCGRRQRLRRARRPRPAHRHPPQRQDRQDPAGPVGSAVLAGGRPGTP